MWDGAASSRLALLSSGAQKIPDGEIWGGIPARFIKKTAPGQAESYAKNYLTIKEWYHE